MQNMNFWLTTEQIRNHGKDVTRRLRWWNARPGQLLSAVVKGIGLKKGEKVVKITTIRIVSTRAEPLHALTDNLEYGLSECRREGFGNHPTLWWPPNFVAWFCKWHGIDDIWPVNRIEFEYVNDRT